TLRSYAESYVVTATVPADQLTEPAIITYPSDQQHLSTAIVDVRGTCPAQSYVKLFRNGNFSGVAQCVNNTFTIRTSLDVGANQLQARVFNLTDSEGPLSSPITVYYDVSAPATPSHPKEPPPARPSPTGPPSTGPLIILTDYKYQVHYRGDPFEWTLEVRGGRQPYTVIVDWGDDSQSTIEIGEGSPLTITHAFPEIQVYEPLITAVDQNGAVVVLQLSAVVKEPVTGPTSSPFASIQRYLWIVWSVYGVVVLMVLSFWLGEQEFARQFADRRAPRRTRAHKGRGV
ncbi:MAG: hypothetical protein AAB834_03445, partial [Patescibacteria group bacterium]